VILPATYWGQRPAEKTARHSKRSRELGKGGPANGRDERSLAQAQTEDDRDFSPRVGRNAAQAARIPALLSPPRRFGFGGPSALAAILQKDLVESEKWVPIQDYVEGLAVHSVPRARRGTTCDVISDGSEPERLGRDGSGSRVVGLLRNGLSACRALRALRDGGLGFKGVLRHWSRRHRDHSHRSATH